MSIATRFLIVVAFMFLFDAVHAQTEAHLKAARQYIEANYADWSLTPEDVSDLHLVDSYTSKHNGVKHFYFIQRHSGIEIYNAILNVNVSKEGKVLFTGNRLVEKVVEKVNTTQPSISAQEAVFVMADHFKAPAASARVPLEIRNQKNSKEIVFKKGILSDSDIPVKLCYQKTTSGKLMLAWNTEIDMVNSSDHWSARIDASTGQVIDQQNFTVYCSFESEAFAHTHKDCREHQEIQASEVITTSAAGSYRVFPIPTESPIHGDHSMVTNPFDAEASPYGWHDTNGADGAEFTITRGNNAHAYLDLDNSNVSKNDEPDGGVDLVFDFPYDPAKEPAELRQAAVTNLFYMNNIMHDFTYRYGFTEEAGNFQFNNYGNGGNAGDFVRAHAQDGGGSNNANFSTPSDGGNGVMQMYIWGSSSGTFRIDEPVEISGWYDTGAADFGPDITGSNSWTGKIVEGKDAVRNPYDTDGCEPLSNPSEINGNIALIDRGGCYFVEKTLHAEAAGAIAVIICNFEVAPSGMTSPAGFDIPTIPTVMLGKPDCDKIRQYLNLGTNVVGTMEEQVITGPSNFDGDFDNGIIAHEYGHGISNRLTGGPSQAGCLGNDEQMGEGWSDFFSLILTVKPGDVGETPRGVGTYAQGQGVNGRGIRPNPYSTDMSVNPVTYSAITQLTVPHGLGSVWCSMLWDMYWAFVDEYGFDPDMTSGSGGNNMAIQLVMDGMKLQPCSPGFIDGRDAILAADQILYGGANQCLIWEVFARRGLGYYADQVDNDNNADGIENFDPLPTCIKELKIKREATPLVDAGEEVTVTITVTNHKEEALTDVVISDEILNGLTFVALESTDGIDISEVEVNTDVPGMVSFELGNMATGTEIKLTYKVLTASDKFSKRLFIEDVPDNSAETINRWLIGFDSEPDVSTNIWNISNIDAHSGDYSWNVDDSRMETRQYVQLANLITVTGDNPVLRFYHRIHSYPGFHGGVVEVSEDGGFIFNSLAQELFRNPYNGLINYSSFTIPNFEAFYGVTNEFIDSYADLNDFKGKEVSFRFRFGTNDVSTDIGDAKFNSFFGSTNGGEGWYVDDIELMDMVNYDPEACVTSSEGDMACAKAPERGTIVESQIVSSTKDLDSTTKFSVFPNPASDVIHLSVDSETYQAANIEVISLSGQVLKSQAVQIVQGEQLLNLSVRDFPEGMYLVRIQTAQGVGTEKVFIK